MSGGPGPAAPGLSAAALTRLMPMHAMLDGDGRIRSIGPTLAKVCGPAARRGALFLDLFCCERPAGLCDVGDLTRHPGARLVFSLRHDPSTVLRGQAAALGEGAGVLLNLSFGIAAAEAVRRHGLTAADFAVTDLTVELLYLSEANAAVTGELVALNDRLRAAHSRAERRALTDSLTGLSNRRALEASLARLGPEGVVPSDRRGGKAPAAAGFALMHLDLDRFKAVNDRLGHAAGDHVLRVVALALRAETRRSDMVARVGGDEFVLLLPGLVEPADVMRLARRIISRLERPIGFHGQSCRISGSIGIALSTDYLPPDVVRMTADADAALYASKRAGRGRATLHRLPPAETAGAATEVDPPPG